MKNSLAGENDSRNVSRLLELMAAYQQSRILFTLVELEIPTVLKSAGKRTAAELARIKNIHPLAMERFLNAAVAVGLLEKSADGYSNSKTSESFLVKDAKFYLGGQVERHRQRSFAVWENLTEKLGTWQYGDREQAAPETDDQGAEAMAEQHNLALLHGFRLAEAFDFSRHRTILDLGGGTGATSIALLQSHPHLDAIVFDLPENVGVAERFIESENLSRRIRLVGGDFKKDRLPDGFDLVLLANFMAVADADENKRLLKTLYEKLPAGGACVLSGWIIDDSHLAPLVPVLFCLEDICWDAPDVERSERVYAQWLREAGFSDIECRTYLEPTKMLYGFKV